MALSKIGSAGLASGAVEAADIADGAITSAKLANPNVFMGRNRIINGAMMIDQRNAGAAVTTSDSYPVDRFFVGNSTDGAFSAQQNSSSPAGFINSTKITVTTADASVTTTQALQFRHIIEGTNVADLGWGTADAKTVTLSFWVRSSLTGTFGGAFNNSAFNRSYPFTYTISVADTWEYKTITVPGDTSGTWLTTNGTGLNIRFGLGVGPDRSGTAGAWAGSSYISATGATSVIGTLNATWYITGVQLEVGSTATDFERRPYGMELALCQRYYFEIEGGTQIPCYQNTTSMTGTVSLPVPMRTVPSISRGAGDCYVWSYNTFYSTSTTTMTIADHGPTSMQAITNTGFSGMGSLTVGVYQSNSKIYLSAEL